jgi:hypothetical protein
MIDRIWLGVLATHKLLRDENTKPKTSDHLEIVRHKAISKSQLYMRSTGSNYFGILGVLLAIVRRLSKGEQ